MTTRHCPFRMVVAGIATGQTQKLERLVTQSNNPAHRRSRHDQFTGSRICHVSDLDVSFSSIAIPRRVISLAFCPLVDDNPPMHVLVRDVGATHDPFQFCVIHESVRIILTPWLRLSDLSSLALGTKVRNMLQTCLLSYEIFINVSK
jgi:hypothetical protein